MYKHLLFIMMIATCATLASCSNDDSEEYLSEQESQNTISTKTLDSEMGLQTAAYEAYKNAMKKLCSQTRSGDVSYPDFYGGSYIDYDGDLVILIKEGYEGDASDLLGTNVDNVVIKNCKYSYNELLNVLNLIRKKAEEKNEILFKTTSMYGIDEESNSVNVVLYDKEQRLIDLFKAKIANSPVLNFMEGDAATLHSGINCGGIISYSKDGKTHNASMGYRAKDTNGNIGIVTAGHFISKGQSLMDSQKNTIGTCLYSRDYDGILDAAFCKITSTNYIPTNRIMYMANTAKDTLSTETMNPPKGSYVNMVGQATGKRVSGTISNVSYDVLNASKKVLLQDVYLASYTSKSGDSGGIVYALRSAHNQRLTVGINIGSARINGTTYGMCVKASNINRIFGLTRY